MPSNDPPKPQPAACPIPYYKIGKHVRYLRKDLDKYQPGGGPPSAG